MFHLEVTQAVDLSSRLVVSERFVIQCFLERATTVDENGKVVRNHEQVDTKERFGNSADIFFS